MIKKMSFCILAFAFLSGCLNEMDGASEGQTRIDETQYEFVVQSDFDLELSRSTSPKTWKILWNESEDGKIEGVLVGDWGQVLLVGEVSTERILHFSSSAVTYGFNQINLVYFILPAGEITARTTITADAFNQDGHFYNAQFEVEPKN